MKRYQAVAFLLSTAMTVSSVAPVFGASSDVFGHWAEFTITKWQNEGRIGGYEDGTFKPDRAITRAEFVRLLNSAAPTAFTSSASINFSDVKESDWFYADVAQAVGGRVASGFEDGTFRPGETVTRMQAAVFICNAKGLTPNEAAANGFTDAAQIPSWAKGAVGAAVSAGYLSGYPDGSFGGSKGMTRAEAVSTLDRVLTGGSTTNTPSGEIDTSNRDNNADVEDNRTADAGDMTWVSGGSSGSRKSSSSSSSSSSSIKTNNITIRSQKEANDYEGKTLTGTTKIYVDGSGINLQDIRFKGDVEIYADEVVAAAYIGDDTAVAAANSTVDIWFEGTTNVTGMITVIRNTVVSADQVVIRTRVPKVLSGSVLAKVATAIKGFEISKVEAQAPVEISEGAKVATVEAGDNAVVVVAEDAEVARVDVTGDAKEIELNGEGSTDITVNNGASVDNVVVKDNVEANIELNGNASVANVAVSDSASAGIEVNGSASVGTVTVSDSASADVAVNDSANVEKVELSDTATATVDVAEDATVNTISSTSSGTTEVSGEGTVEKIEATDLSTIKTENAGENIATPEKKDETTTTPETVLVTEITVTAEGDAKEIEAGGSLQMSAKVTPENATNQELKWSLTVSGGISETDVNIDTKGLLTVTNAELTSGTITVTATATDGSSVSGKYEVTVKAKDETPAPPEETKDPQITAITASGSAVSGTVVTVGNTDVTVNLDAAVNADIPAGSNITWEITDKAGITDTKLAVAPTTTTVADSKASTVLTVPTGVVADTDTEGKTIVVTATYTPEAEDNGDGAGAQAVTPVTKTISLKLVTETVAASTVAEVAVTPNSAEIDLNDTTADANKVALKAVVTSATGAKLADKTVTWIVEGAEDTTNTKVDPTTGTTAADTGEVSTTLTVGADETATSLTVKATCDEVDGTATVTVTPKTVAVENITVAGKDGATTVEAGKTLQMVETVTPDNATNKTVEWTAKDADGKAITGVTISAAGLLSVEKTVSEETEIKVTATAQDGSGKSGTVTITVTAAQADTPEIALASGADAKGFSLVGKAITVPANTTVKGLTDVLEVKVGDAASDEYKAVVYASSEANAQPVTGDDTVLLAANVVKIVKVSDNTALEGNYAITVSPAQGTISATATVPQGASFEVNKVIATAGVIVPVEVTGATVTESAVTSANVTFEVTKENATADDTGLTFTPEAISGETGKFNVKITGTPKAEGTYTVKVKIAKAVLTATTGEVPETGIETTFDITVDQAQADTPEIGLVTGAEEKGFGLSATGNSKKIEIPAGTTLKELTDELQVTVKDVVSTEYTVAVYASDAEGANAVSGDNTVIEDTNVVKILKESEAVGDTYKIEVTTPTLALKNNAGEGFGMSGKQITVPAKTTAEGLIAVLDVKLGNAVIEDVYTAKVYVSDSGDEVSPDSTELADTNVVKILKGSDVIAETTYTVKVTSTTPEADPEETE